MTLKPEILRAALTVLVALGVAWPAVARETLTIGLNDRGSAPFIAGEGTALPDPPGLAVEILQEAGRRLDIGFRFVRMPGQRVLSELRAGRLDGALLFSYAGERRADGAYPMRGDNPDAARRLATLSYVLYRRSGSAVEWTGERFLNLSGQVAASRNYSIADDLREIGVSVLELQSIADSFRMLKAGRVVAVADHASVADAYIAAAGITDVERAGPTLREKPYFLLLSHSFAARQAEKATAIWDTIAALRDPMTERLLPRYLPGR